MAEYIEKEDIKKSISFFFDIKWKITQSPIEVKQAVLEVIDGERAADVQPVKQWHKYPDDIPPYDGDYLCYHKGYCNVYEYFHEKWFSESGEEVKQIDDKGLYWQDLPTYPDATKG